MKHLLNILMIMTILSSAAQDGKSTTIKKTFNRTTSVSIMISADRSIVWALLTNALDYSRWNSTIVSIEGEIELGKKIKLRSTLDPKRTFKLKIKEMVSEARLTWGDGKGNRTYTIEPLTDSSLRFTMSEKMGGIMFPMYAKYLPEFDDSFERFAKDLKQESELIQNESN